MKRRTAGAVLVALLLCPAAMFAAPSADPFAAQRRSMVEQQIERRGVTAPSVLSAMGEVPRHLFVPPGYRDKAYEDSPLPIGNGQTISQPYVVALMTQLLDLKPGDRVLEIGTGSGYQAAVLSKLVKDVYTIEILEPLGLQAERTLQEIGAKNVHVRIGDGYKGWPEAAPFDGIVVTAAPERVPQPLLDQLRVGGKMVIPVGAFFQNLLVITKTADGIEKRSIIPVRFVPMTGEAQDPKQ
ncbi:MAG: protein-L-isoaspartate(D-aspartate) O-methyltransferase [Acidobacteriota bacterium]